MPSVISKNQLGLSEVNIGKIYFGPPQVAEIKPKAPLPAQLAPTNQPIQSTPPALLNEPAVPTSPIKSTQLEPPPNLPV